MLIALMLGLVSGALWMVSRPGFIRDPTVLRVCADPNNLPFSNAAEEGFENEIARMAAADLGARVSYTWWPQRRGFIRSTLDAELCDVVMGVPQDFEMAATTRSYYASTYVSVTRGDRGLHITSLDDPRLRALRIGVHLIGDDYASVPPGHALAARGLADNLRGFSIYGDYAFPDPPAALIEAVENRSVDIAIAWGPLAGFFAARRGDLAVDALDSMLEERLSFAISIGVRRNDRELRDKLDRFLEVHACEVTGVLDRFHVPRISLPESRRVSR